MTELLGGWPGAFLAQRRLRHKCSKVSYQFVFWLIVLAYQFAAFDSIQNWRFSRAAWDYVGRFRKHAQVAPSDSSRRFQVRATVALSDFRANLVCIPRDPVCLARSPNVQLEAEV
jgi:hypothetical protein